MPNPIYPLVRVGCELVLTGCPLSVASPLLHAEKSSSATGSYTTPRMVLRSFIRAILTERGVAMNVVGGSVQRINDPCITSVGILNSTSSVRKVASGMSPSNFPPPFFQPGIDMRHEVSCLSIRYPIGAAPTVALSENCPRYGQSLQRCYEACQYQSCLFFLFQELFLFSPLRTLNPTIVSRLSTTWQTMRKSHCSTRYACRNCRWHGSRLPPDEFNRLVQQLQCRVHLYTLHGNIRIGRTVQQQQRGIYLVRMEEGALFRRALIVPRIAASTSTGTV